MDNQLLRVFQREIERQCCFALIAFEDLNSSLDDGNLDRLRYKPKETRPSHWAS